MPYYPRMSALDGKLILVTGAARGVGAAIARHVVDAGGQVIAADVLDEPGRASVAALGDAARYEHLDVADPDDWQRVLAPLDRLDGLVNNAAVLYMGSIEETPLAEARRLIEVNLFGVFLGIRACAPLLKAAGRGAIVNTGSVDGLHGMNSVGVYSSTKWGVRGLAKAAAFELGQHGVRVNTVHPALGSMEMSRPFASRVDYARYRPHIPPAKLRYDGEPYQVSLDDTARMTVFLLSDAAQGITGADIPVDAGFTQGIFAPGLPDF